MKINELEENKKVVNLIVTINSLEDIVTTPDGKKVREGVASDETGQVKISFWNEQVEEFKIGEKIMVVTGWCKCFEDELKVSSGKFGKIVMVPPEKVN